MTHTAARARRGATRRGGFTLVELLVVVAVIAILIGILLPAIGSARNAARGGACLGNCHQFGVAWHAYLLDYKYMPYREDGGRVQYLKDWAGVHWFGDDPPSPANRWAPERPLNPYLEAELVQKEHFPGLMCPADDDLNYRDKNGLTVKYWSDDAAAEVSESEFASSTIYGVRGSSYTSNDWLWVKPGSTDGYGDYDTSGPEGDPFNYKNFTNRNQLSTVSSPSRFIIINDADDSEAWRVSASFRHWSSSDGLPAGMPFGAWHGYEKTNAAFLDGSARNVRIEENRGATAEYTFWVQPELHGPGSATIASKPRLSVAAPVN